MWREGLFLQPHHFQQLSIGVHALTARHAHYANPHGWGVVALEIDPLQLEQGQFDLRTLELVFPTGELLIHGSDGPVNATIQTREIPKVAEARLKVYVGVRRVREHESNVGEPGEKRVSSISPGSETGIRASAVGSGSSTEKVGVRAGSERIPFFDLSV
jgi:predicted component of type VI protein secretion system